MLISPTDSGLIDVMRHKLAYGSYIRDLCARVCVNIVVIYVSTTCVYLCNCTMYFHETTFDNALKAEMKTVKLIELVLLMIFFKQLTPHSSWARSHIALTHPNWF